MNMPLQSTPRPAVVDRDLAFTMPRSVATLDGFRQWTLSDAYPETGSVAYIGGEIIVDMSAERIDSHSSVKTEICTVLNGIIRGRLGALYIDSTRLVNTPADLSNEPDAVFVAYESVEQGRVRMTPAAGGDDTVELEGTPDWVLEIVSPSSMRKDNVLLRKRYFMAGIPEYWIVNVLGQLIDFRILNPSGDSYVQAAVTKGGWIRSTVFGRRFRLVRERDRVGHWLYTLQVKR
jgi:Uma2 family endonuclease